MAWQEQPPKTAARRETRQNRDFQEYVPVIRARETIDSRAALPPRRKTEIPGASPAIYNDPSQSWESVPTMARTGRAAVGIVQTVDQVQIAGRQCPRNGEIAREMSLSARPKAGSLFSSLPWATECRSAADGVG